MTEAHELELEGSTQGEERFRECLVAQIAQRVSTGDITDDNPSPTKGYTSLDQILRFTFLINGQETLDDLRESVFDEAKKSVNCKDEEANRLIDKYSKLPKKLRKQKDASRDGLIISLAKSICEGQITDDNPSPERGYTSLDQIIQFYFDIREKEYKRLEKIRNRVFQKIEKYQDDPDRFCMY